MIRPSNADRWVNCPASAKLEDNYSSTSGPAAKEGQEVHATAKNILIGGSASPDYYLRIYTDYCKSLPGETRIETPVRVFEGLEGTPDFWAYDGETLHIPDLKWGYGIVEPGWQLICYAVGVINTFLKSQPLPVVKLTIVQPRAPHIAGPIRHRIIQPVELSALSDKLYKAYFAAQAGATSASGPWCHYCAARTDCETNIRAVYNAVDLSGQAVLMTSDIGKLAKEYSILLRAFEAISLRKESIESQLIERLKSGTPVSGWGTTQTLGRMDWTKPINEVVALGKMFGVEISKPGVITPNQAIEGGIPEEIIKQYAERKSGTLKLMPDTELKSIFLKE